VSTKELTGCDDTRQWLLDAGFKVCHTDPKPYSNCNWYAYKRTDLDAPECECNEGKGTQIVVNPFETDINGKRHQSVEIDVTGEAGEVWYCLKAYSLNAASLPESLPTIERSLVAAWSALERPSAIGSAHEALQSGDRG
jgi:hypothetical protein